MYINCSAKSQLDASNFHCHKLGAVSGRYIFFTLTRNGIDVCYINIGILASLIFIVINDSEGEVKRTSLATITIWH